MTVVRDPEIIREIEHEIRYGTPDTPQRIATIKRADEVYARWQRAERHRQEGARVPWYWVLVPSLLVLLTLALAFFTTRDPTRDLNLYDTNERVVATIRLAPDTVLIASSGERCHVTMNDAKRAHPDELWVCRWEKP